jgi:hypothetical protein
VATAGKPSNPFAPSELLPQLCPAVHIWGCSYTKEGSFSAGDVTPLPGREPQGDNEVPTVRNWADFLQVRSLNVEVHGVLLLLLLVTVVLRGRTGSKPACDKSLQLLRVLL